MKIEILGTGCVKCKTLFKEAQKAVEQAGINAEIVKVEKLEDIMNYGVMITPALVVNGDVKFAGKVKKASEIIEYFL